jgi:hypothetical protein
MIDPIYSDCMPQSTGGAAICGGEWDDCSIAPWYRTPLDAADIVGLRLS